MNSEIIENKLISLDRCLRRIEAKIPSSADELAEDYDTQDIIAVNLERAVQQCVDISGHLVADIPEPFPSVSRELFDLLARRNVLSKEVAQSMSSAVSLRNLAVHEYQRIDWYHLHRLLGNRLSEFRQFTAAIAAYVGIDDSDRA